MALAVTALATASLLAVGSAKFHLQDRLGAENPPREHRQEGKVYKWPFYKSKRVPILFVKILRVSSPPAYDFMEFSFLIRIPGTSS